MNVDEELINKAYDDMLSAADSLSVDSSSEDAASKLKAVKDVVDDFTVFTEEASKDVDFTTTSAQTTIGTYNSITGEMMPSESDQSENIVKKISDKQFDMFTSDNNNDITIDKNILSKLFSSRELENISDIEAISNIVKDKINGKRIRFDDLPSSIKSTVLGIVANQKTQSGQFGKADLNAVADLVANSLAEDYKKNVMSSFDIDAMLSGFNKDLENMQNDMSKRMGSMYLDTDETRKAELDAAIERCKSEGKEDAIKKLENMKKAIDNAYNLEDFSEFCKKVRIKNFELEKPKRVFSSFNTKYETHTNNINDISACPMILDRHIKDDPKSNLKVCIAFCKYCMNMSPDNIEEHTFMYYFIRNIITIDRINPKGLVYESISGKEKDFYDGFLSNISKCIYNVNNR